MTLVLKKRKARGDDRGATALGNLKPAVHGPYAKNLLQSGEDVGVKNSRAHPHTKPPKRPPARASCSPTPTDRGTHNITTAQHARTNRAAAKAGGAC